MKERLLKLKNNLALIIGFAIAGTVVGGLGYTAFQAVFGNYPLPPTNILRKSGYGAVVGAAVGILGALST